MITGNPAYTTKKKADIWQNMKGSVFVLKEFSKPHVLIDSSTEFEGHQHPCSDICHHTVQQLDPFVEYQAFFIREDDDQMIDPATNQRINLSMSDVDGLLLKNKHACLKNELLQQYQGAACAVEEDLNKALSRHDFLTKLFTVADFREIKKEEKIKAIQAFQARHKYLFMAYHPGISKQLGRISANHEHLEWEAIVKAFEEGLWKLLEQPPKPSAHVNVCQHIAGYFKKELTKEDKINFQALLQQYVEKRVSLTAVIRVLHSWAVQFQQEYLLNQSYFSPYPNELIKN